MSTRGSRWPTSQDSRRGHPWYRKPDLISSIGRPAPNVGDACHAGQDEENCQDPGGCLNIIQTRDCKGIGSGIEEYNIIFQKQRVATQ